MSAFEMSKYAPYRSLEEYQLLRPDYFFGGQSAEELVTNALIQSLEGKTGGRVAECGCGPGPLWKYLPRDLEVLAVEPNRELWSEFPPPQVAYHEKDGFDFLSQYEGKLDAILWMWAINYPLLSMFEHYDPIRKTVEMNEWLSAHHQCLDRMVGILEKRAASDWVVLYFDGSSVEQSFVTKIWEEVAPFPFRDRSHTRKILEMAFELQAFRTGATFSSTRLAGFAEYGELEQAVERMMSFHLRGNFRDQAGVRQQVREFLAPFQVDGRVRCPAGAYLFHYRAPR